MTKEESMLWLYYDANPDRQGQAMTKLIEYYKPWVAKIASSLSMHHHLARAREDMIQEGLIAVMLKIETFDISLGFEFKTHAGARVEGSMRDFITGENFMSRKYSRMAARGKVFPVFVYQMMDDKIDHYLASECSHMREFLAKDQREVYLGTLDPKVREALEMWLFTPLDRVEIGERLGITQGAASKRIRKGMQILRSLYVPAA